MTESDSSLPHGAVIPPLPLTAEDLDRDHGQTAKSGLWLARALDVSLVGVDWSPVGIRAATDRAEEFVPAGRARFQVGDMTATGLDAGSVDGAICADAIFFAPDRIAVVAEVARVLGPGGRLLFTADENDNLDRPGAVPDWAPIIELGGLDVVLREEIPNWATQIKQMYDAWLENIDALRAELGDESADELVNEAQLVAPTLSRRTGVLCTAEKRRR